MSSSVLQKDESHGVACFHCGRPIRVSTSLASKKSTLRSPDIKCARVALEGVFAEVQKLRARSFICAKPNSGFSTRPSGVPSTTELKPCRR